MCDIIYINLPETGEPGHTLLTVRLWDINKSPRPESCAGAELDLGNEESPSDVKVRFSPVFHPYVLNRELDGGSGSCTIGEPWTERKVRFKFRSSSGSRESEPRTELRCISKYQRTRKMN